MFERFTDRARRVIVLAQEEARALQHNYIGTEHLLLGLIREGEGVAAKALASKGVELDATRKQVEEMIGKGNAAPNGHIPFTPHAKQVLEFSLREALQLGHSYIGTEHILLGLIREGEGVGTQVLIKMDVDLGELRSATIDMIRGNSGTGTGDGLIGFEGDGAAGVREITTRLLDGEFPKVRHLMSVQATLTVRANTAEVIAAVKRVGLVAERNTSLRMIIGDQAITLEAATGDQAQAVEALEAVVERHHPDAEAMTAAGFNPHYLLDALNALDTPYVNFAFTAPGKPCLLTPLVEIDGEPSTDYKHVIMLMRLPQ